MKESYNLSSSELQGLRARTSENAKNMGTERGGRTETDKETDDQRLDEQRQMDFTGTQAQFKVLN